MFVVCLLLLFDFVMKRSFAMSEVHIDENNDDNEPQHSRAQLTCLHTEKRSKKTNK